MYNEYLEDSKYTVRSIEELSDKDYQGISFNINIFEEDEEDKHLEISEEVYEKIERLEDSYTSFLFDEELLLYDCVVLQGCFLKDFSDSFSIPYGIVVRLYARVLKIRKIFSSLFLESEEEFSKLTEKERRFFWLLVSRKKDFEVAKGLWKDKRCYRKQIYDFYRVLKDKGLNKLLWCLKSLRTKGMRKRMFSVLKC